MRATHLTFHTRLAIIAVAAAYAVLPSAASAYVGPGAGLSMFGSLAAVVFSVLAAVVGLVLLPLRMMIKAVKARGAVKAPNAPAEALSPSASD